MLNETLSHERKRLCQEFLDAAIARLEGEAAAFGWSEKDFTAALAANARARQERDERNRGVDQTERSRSH